MTSFPFEVSVSEIESNPQPYIDAVFSLLESEFLVMPRGKGFIDYPTFENGYEALKAATRGFGDFDVNAIFAAVLESPLIMLVLRSMLGFSPPEWAYITTRTTQVDVSQGFARSLDRDIRMNPTKKRNASKPAQDRIKAMVFTACKLLVSELTQVGPDKLHRLDKADTSNGASSINSLATLGVPYAMLLYERLLGRPFAGHRDSVSDLIGDGLENAIEEILSDSGISFRKTKRAEKIQGFDQTPDFIIPSEFNPQIVIEAKITEDDGTARDKVTRVQHLAAISNDFKHNDRKGFQVIACIGGRGFGVRREDMKKLILATKGKVFTLQSIDQMVEYTDLNQYKSR